MIYLLKSTFKNLDNAKKRLEPFITSDRFNLLSSAPYMFRKRHLPNGKVRVYTYEYGTTLYPDSSYASWGGGLRMRSGNVVRVKSSGELGIYECPAFGQDKHFVVVLNAERPVLATHLNSIEFVCRSAKLKKKCLCCKYRFICFTNKDWGKPWGVSANG